jgi:hypothetical protein
MCQKQEKEVTALAIVTRDKMMFLLEKRASLLL